MTTVPELKPFTDILDEALKSVPPGSSPVFCLLGDIWTSPAGLGTRKTRLARFTSSSVQTQMQGWRIHLSSSGDYITISGGALDLVWWPAARHGPLWFIYRAFVDARKTGESTVKLGQDQE